MCGIVGFCGNNAAAPFLLRGLESLEYRGYDSAGIALIGEHEISVNKTVDRIGSLMAATNNGHDLTGSVGIGHTRWATHGAPSHDNAHPHLSGNGCFAVVHNGIIENYAELRDELIAEGVCFKSETDTEVVPHLLQKYYNGDLIGTISKVIARLEGSYALGIICLEHPNTLMAVRKFSPLIIGLGDTENYIASDVTAIVSKTRDIVYIDDGQIAKITPQSIEIFDTCGSKIDYTVSHIDWDVAAAEKGGFEHFMMKEIFEQPRAFEQTVTSRVKNGEIVFDDLVLNADTLARINRITIVACGSAYHAGIVGKYVIEEMLRIPCDVDLASEYRYRNPITDSNTLTIIISQSGETADTLAALNEAKRRGSHTLAIVNVVGSSIAKAADDVIYTWAGPEIAVATTKGYTTQLAVLYMFSIWAAKLKKSMTEGEIDNVMQSLLSLPEAISEVLLQKDKIKHMAKHSVGEESLFFIGRNIDYAVALEASLKLKEISYIHSEAYAAGELKHGTISLIEEGRTVVALACQENFFDKLVSNIKEVHARGAYVIACANEGDTAINEVCEEAIFVPPVHPLLKASVEVVPFQLYAYYVALYRGCDIDKPRNLAKSVTVE